MLSYQVYIASVFSTALEDMLLDMAKCSNESQDQKVILYPPTP